MISVEMFRIMMDCHYVYNRGAAHRITLIEMALCLLSSRNIIVEAFAINYSH